MSDKPISVGDLVMVVRYMDCGCNLGNIGTVIGFARIHRDECDDCSTGSCLPHSGDGVRVKDAGGIARYPMEWLKRIPPYEQLKHFRSEELLRRDVKEKA